ncbi:hypothetical protein [Bartonella rattaustraliani]|nr:hypothetical protein [Bartonella rattaustraliani]
MPHNKPVDKSAETKLVLSASRKAKVICAASSERLANVSIKKAQSWKKG